jgi:hypothetical protein
LSIKTLERTVLLLAATIFLGEKLVQSGFFAYVSNLPNLPVVAFLLILFADFYYGAKHPKYL